MTRPKAHTNGVLVVDKPAGWTSHDVVGKLRGVVGQKRIGHAGTLDPGATGVLVVALGSATKLMRFVSELPKSYVGEVVLGSTTTTLDDEGETTATFAMNGVSLDAVRTVAEQFVGGIEQVPPMVSALKVDGKRLHELAREGIEVERKARPVTIHSLVIDAEVGPGVFRIGVQCSSGTYIRTLAADIGQALGGGAHLRKLRRTAIGPFTLDTSSSMKQLQEDWRAHLLAPVAMVDHYAHVVVGDEGALAIRHGKRLPAELAGDHDGPFAMINVAGDLLAVYGRDGDELRSLMTMAGE